MRNGVQEYEFTRLLSQKEGNTYKVDSLVNSIIKQPFGDKSIGNLDVWSFDPARWDATRILLGDEISKEN